MLDKSLSARLCVALLLPRLHQRRTPRACTRGALAPTPEAHSPRLHQRHSSRLHQRRTPRACTRGALLAPTPVAHLSRLHEVTHLHTPEACISLANVPTSEYSRPCCTRPPHSCVSWMILALSLIIVFRDVRYFV